MELTTLLDPASVHNVEDIKFDSRLLFKYRRDRLTTERQRVGFHYTKFHEDAVAFFATMSADVPGLDVTTHTDANPDGRTTAAYLVLGADEVLMYLGRYYPDILTSIMAYIKALKARILALTAERDAALLEAASARVAVAFQRDYGWMENLVENLKPLQKVHDIAEELRGYNLSVPVTHRTTRAAIDKELRTYVGLLLAQVPEDGLDLVVRTAATRVCAAAGEDTP